MQGNPSIKDSLTGAYSSDYFYEQLNKEIQRSNRYKIPFSMAMTDIDNFNKINTQYGEEFGDLLLKQLAEFYQNNTRGTDVIVRYESDSFIAILPEIDLSDALSFSERITHIVTNHVFGTEKDKIKITLSIGVVSYSHKDPMEIEQMIALLDTSVYQAKQGGGNCIVPYTSVLHKNDFI